MSDRETFVVAHVLRGTSLKELAYLMAISISSVATYLARVKRKLGVTTRSELMATLAGDVPSLTCLPSDLRDQLTASEKAIAAALLGGLSNATIAEARSTSLRTVENQVSQVLRKLGVASRAELLAATLNTGSPPPTPS